MAYTIQSNLISMNRSGKTLIAKGTVLHETETPGASDEDEFRYFNNDNRNASAHAFVDYDSITQTIPWQEQAWHAGATANKNYIGIELCHYEDTGKFNEVWKRAVWLFAYIHVNVIKVTTINKDTLMSHAEVSSKWGETDHKDPISYFSIFGKTVDDFRREVQALINSMISAPQDPPTNGNSSIIQLQKILNKLKITDYNRMSLVEDGINGPRTISAVKRFQAICGLSIDGIAGPKTFSAINQILSKPLIKTGSSGIPVRYIQFRFGISNDGIFGYITKNAVILFQSRNGLVKDGIVGPNTWTKLIG